jgi:hypothetical protein
VDIAGQFSWLNSTLLDARKNGEKVYIIAHIVSGNEFIYVIF